MKHAIGLEGLLQAQVKAVLVEVEGAVEPGPGVDPGLALASRFALVSAEVGLDGKGATPILERSTGLALPELLQLARQEAGAVPEDILTPMLGWVETAMTKGNAVAARPGAPVPLLAIAMTAAMNPLGLGSLLKIEAE